jgi:hypothetical protein
MGKQSPTFRDFNPTGDGRVTRIKEETDRLIAYVRVEALASGPETQRRASLAVTAYEQAAMWAVKALFSEDAIKGDDGGAPASSPYPLQHDDVVSEPASASEELDRSA